MIRLEVPEPSPSLNVTRSVHWTTRERMKKRWRSMLALAGANAAPKANGRRRVTILRYGKQMVDVDNGYGGCKMLIDELRRFGLIIDDNPNAIELTFRNEKLPKGEQPKTIIEIEDLPA